MQYGTIRQFRARIFDIVADADEEDEAFTITKHGKPIAVLVGLNRYHEMLDIENDCE